jgi:hypothetical protein
MTGKQRYRSVKSSQTARKEDRPLIFSGVLGVTTNAENQVEVPGRPGFVWVRLRNQLNELIQAFNEEVSPVFDLPVRVEYDEANPIRYKVIGRDVGRYTVWVTTNAAGDTVSNTSPYLPAHGASHSFNTLTGVGGGDVVWVYSQQFTPWLVTPSGSSGANSVSVQPSSYYYDQQFRWAGGTGIAGFDTLRPTGSSNARMLLVYLDPDTGNVLLATGSLTEFANTITGTAEIMPYMPSLIEPTDIPLAGVRLITGSLALLWPNVYDLRDYFSHSSVSGTGGGGGGAPDDAEYVVMSADATLTDERVLTAGADITLADGGAGGNATVGVATGTFSRDGHSHVFPYGVAVYDDLVFQATGTLISFDDEIDIIVSGTSVFVKSNINRYYTHTTPNVLSVNTGNIRLYNLTGEALILSKVHLAVNTAPTDAAIIVDINENGTTLFSTPSNRPQINAGSNIGETITFDDNSWADNNYLTIDIDQIGSGTAGSDLTVTIIGKHI